MTEQEVIAALDALPADDCEQAHMDADALLLNLVNNDVIAAYIRVVDRCKWWAHA